MPKTDSEKREWNREYMRRRRKDPDFLKREAAYRSSPQRKEALRRWVNENSHKDKAKAKVRNAIRDGRLFRGSACEHCGSQRSLEAHHASYAEDMWLAVTWLCVPCHKRLHIEHREKMEN